MKFKKLLAIITASAMVFGLAACGGNEDSKTEEGGETAKTENSKDSGEDDNALTIWAWDEAFNIKAAEDAKEIYTKENPDAEINIVTMAQDDIVAKLNTSLSSGSYDGLPDIVLIED